MNPKKMLQQVQQMQSQMQQQMDDLSRQQEELQKKVKDAAALQDQKERAEELKKLARQQQELQKKAAEMADELKRLRAERASQAMAKAAGQMDQAGQQLQRGENADDQQDDALDRLDDAQHEMERAVGDAEEALAREQLGKIADQLKRLKERQEGLAAENARLQKEVQQRKGWDRGRLFSLSDLARAQKGLGEETAKVAEEKLSDARVFGRILRKSARAMDDAGKQLAERYQEVSKAPQETDGQEETAKLQQEAVRRIDQLLDAIKPEPGVPQGAGGGGGGGAGRGGGGSGDGIPALAQLKLLRSLQQEVSKRTEEFGRQHPNAKELTDKEKSDLQTLRRDQEEVADLLEEMTRADEPEGGKP